jgi:hypothetical protein
LSGCGASPFADAARLPPEGLLQPCAGPVDLPDRGLGDQEIEVLWGRDRTALRDCAARHDGLASWAMPGGAIEN